MKLIEMEEYLDHYPERESTWYPFRVLGWLWWRFTSTYFYYRYVWCLRRNITHLHNWEWEDEWNEYGYYYGCFWSCDHCLGIHNNPEDKKPWKWNLFIVWY